MKDEGRRTKISRASSKLLLPTCLYFESTVSQPVPSGAGPHGEGFLCPAPPGGVFTTYACSWPLAQ